MDRRVVHLAVPTIADIAVEHHVPRGDRFALLLLYDAGGVDVAPIGAMARRLLDAGLAAFDVWGPDCERVHDVMDEEGLGYGDRTPDDPVVVTSWYADDTLEDALWSFLYAPTVDEAYASSCTVAITVTVGNGGWAEEVIRLMQTKAFEDNVA